VSDELRKRLGTTFTLSELAEAYESVEDWAGAENLEERVDGEDSIDPFVLERLRAKTPKS